jgi:urea transporter
MEVKPGHEAVHSPPSSALFRNVFRYSFTLPYVFMGWFLVKHSHSFAITSPFLPYIKSLL